MRSAVQPRSGVTRRWIALTVLLASATPGLRAEPLRTDPRLVTGELPNGVRWIFRPHASPPGRMAVFMHVRTGSLNETDAQRGIAHFLEHMVFNGTEHFPPGELVPYFAKLGLGFGPDLNANTSFERTIYQLFLPSAAAEEIDRALLVFRDYAFGCLLGEDEIDKERGVILAEARSKKSPQQRVRDRLWPQLYAGTRFAERMPIGLEEIIQTAPREEFVDYYRTWYRPEHITLLFVGDTDPAVLPPLIAKHFTSTPALLPPREPQPAGFRRFTRERAIVLSDPELTTAGVQIVNVLNPRPPSTTVEAWRNDLVESLAIAAFDRRCDARVRRGKASYRSAGARASNLFNEGISIMLVAQGDGPQWADMLGELIAQAHSARELGFSESEIALVKRQKLAQAEQAATADTTRSPRTIITEMADALDIHTPLLSAEEELNLTRKLIDTVTVSEVTRAFRHLYAPGTYAYVVTLPETPGLAIPEPETVLEIARQAWLREPESPPADSPAQQLLAEELEPGQVVESSVDERFGVTHARLANGVRVHHRQMSEKKNQVLVSVVLAGGGIEETAGNLGISLVAGLIPANPATLRINSVDFRDLRAGRTLTIGGGPVTDDAFALRVTATPADLELGLTIVRTLLTEGVIERAAFDNWVKRTAAEIDKNLVDVDARARDAVNALLSGGDPRRLSLRRAQLDALRIEDGQAWFERLARTAPIEIAVVGDIAWDTVRPQIEKLFGSLPTRPPDAGHLAPLRKVSRAPGPLTRRVEVRTLTPSAMAYVGFAGAMAREVDDTRRLRIAADIISRRLVQRLREELALVYGINAVNTPGYIYEDAGRFYVGARCRPDTVDQVVTEIEKIFEAFAGDGPSDDEVDATRRRLLNSLETTMREPFHWIELLQYHDLHGRSLDDAATAADAYKAVTAGQVRDTFRKYCIPQRSFRVVSVPSEAATTAPADTPATAPAAHH